VVVVLALVAGFMARAGVFSAKGSPTSTTKGTANSSMTWKTFRDGDGLYTLQMPIDWQVQSTVDEGTTGLGSQGSIPMDQEMVALGATLSAGPAPSVSVSIIATPIPNSALAHSYYCGAFPGPPSTQTFDGISTTSMGPGTWLFNSARAHFQIDATIPGVMVPANFGPAEPTAIPLSPAQLATAKTNINEILTSFQLTDPKPLAC
jgi:hypothetical protein